LKAEREALQAQWEKILKANKPKSIGTETRSSDSQTQSCDSQTSE
jgi:hypothetical protein